MRKVLYTTKMLTAINRNMIWQHARWTQPEPVSPDAPPGAQVEIKMKDANTSEDWTLIAARSGKIVLPIRELAVDAERVRTITVATNRELARADAIRIEVVSLEVR